jgi:hypothetical protein
MEYVLVGILVLLLVGGFITFLVMQATRRSTPATATDESADERGDQGTPGVGADATPLGDTTEHAGETTAAGETVGDQDAEKSGGTGQPASGEESVGSSGDEPASPSADNRFQRDPIGGEAEARPFTSQ